MASCNKIQKFDPMSSCYNDQSSACPTIMTPPPPYDSSRHGTEQRSFHFIPQGAFHRHYPARPGTIVRYPGNSPLKRNVNGNHQALHDGISYQCEEKKFIFEHHLNGSSDFGHHCCSNGHCRRSTTVSPSPPNGSTCSSSSRSSIASTLASTLELRQLGCGSPHSQCSPSPALDYYRQQTASPRNPCHNCQSPGSDVGRIPSRSGLFASPADTTIIHSRNDSYSSTQGPLMAARYPVAFTSGCDGICACYQQHAATPPLLTAGGGGGGGGGGGRGRGVMRQCNSHPVLAAHNHQQQQQSVFSSSPPTPPAAGSYRTLISASVSLLNSSKISPGGTGVLLSTSHHNKAALAPVNPARSVSALNGGTLFSPLFLQQCAPLKGSDCTLGVTARNPQAQMNRSRDISAPVFSQTCSEDLEDELPPYKPPISRPKLPTTTAKSLNRSVDVEKKIEQLTEELSQITTTEPVEDGDLDDDENYYGQCYACSERVIGEDNACQAMGNLYHTNCFICNICGRILRGKAFYHVKGQIMCEEDYLYSGFQSSADKCIACGHLIMDMALGKSYHPGCFRCCVCQKKLDGAPFTVDIEGKIFCIEDYQGRYAPVCASCKLPITPVEGSYETVRVVSMEQNFHVDCYACKDCRLQLTDKPKERRCYPLDGHLLCHACHMKRRELKERQRTSKLTLPEAGPGKPYSKISLSDSGLDNSSGSSSVRSSIRSRHRLQL